MNSLCSKGPLFLEGWVACNEALWGAHPIRLDLHQDGKETPTLEAILYLDRRGRVYLPPRNPYLAISFHPTPAQRVSHLSGQWRSVAGMLAMEFRRRRLAHFDLSLPPETEDVRPWQWAGYRAAVRYTFYIDFPFDLELADNMVRKQIKKSLRAACYCDRTENLDEVFQCIRETEVRQSFQLNGFSLNELQMGHSFLGPEHYRAYTGYASNGDPASGLVVLHKPGHRAIALFFGTKSTYLDTGVARLLILTAFRDLEAAGAIGLDFGGVSTPNIARAKEALGGYLMRYYSLEDYNVRQLVRWLWNAVHARRKRWMKESERERM